MNRWLETWDKSRVSESGGRGQVGIVRTHGFSSWLIRLITRSHVNHMVNDTGTELISAEYPHVRTRPYGYFTNIVWSQFDYTDDQKEKIVTFAEDQVGKPYGWADDLAIGIGLITRQRTPRWLARWLATDGEWICSSLADASLRHAGIHIFNDDRPVGATFPGSFEAFFRDARWLPKRIFFSKRV
jgi:hypothetical protein